MCGAEILLDDFLIAENSPYQSDVNTPVLTSERSSSPRTNPLTPFDPLTPDNGSQSPSSGGLRLVLIYILKGKG